MKLLGRDCGCGDRQHIMFEAGRPDRGVVIVVAASIFLLVLAWKVKP